MPALPRETLLARLDDELAEARKPHPFRLKLTSAPGEIPLRLSVTLFEAPGPVLRGDEVADSFVHRFEMQVGEEYPYAKPVISWRSAIFHPNVQPPEEGGRFCTRLLEGLTLASTLTEHIAGIARLLARPDPSNPFGTPTARAAAERFRKSPYVAPVVR